jgi:hypothetical protein
LHHCTSLFSRTPKRQCLCACMSVCLSTRLDSFRLCLSRSLSLSLSLSLVFLRVAKRKRLGAKAQCVPKATTTPKGQRVQIIIRYKGWGEGGSQQRFDWLLANNSFADWSIWKKKISFLFFSLGATTNNPRYLSDCHLVP